MKMLSCRALLLLLVALQCQHSLSDPSSKPYVPFRTDPFDQPVHHDVELTSGQQRSNVRKFRGGGNDADQCPLQFTLGISKRSHHHSSTDNNRNGGGALSLVSAPVIYPVYPSRGPGKQVLYATQYEHLDLLTPASAAQVGIMAKTTSKTSSSFAIKEGLVQQEDYPLLFESSSFHASPIIHDVNGDGIPDAILVDYDGGIYVVGLDAKPKERRYFSRAQIPRMYIRRNWMESRLNETLRQQAAADNTTNTTDGTDDTAQGHDPYHSYFEYTTATNPNDKVLRGVTANVMGQDNADLKGLEERRKRKVDHKRTKEDTKQEERDVNHSGDLSPVDEENKNELHDTNEDHEALHGRRLQEHEVEHHGGDQHGNEEAEHRDEAHESAFMDEHKKPEEIVAERDEMMERKDLHPDDDMEEGRGYADDLIIANHDYSDPDYGDDMMDREERADREERPYPGDDDYRGFYDDVYMGHDDYTYNRGYYDEQHYIRIPPHVLCDPILVEMKKPYVNNNEEEDDVLIIAVSYYLDEDEYEGHFSYKRFENTDHGDETEMQRGMYVSNALMFYKWTGTGTGSWGRQEQLDLSGDFSAPQNSSLVAAVPIATNDSRMGAFALSTPTVADLDGDGSLDLLLGTSMGLVYLFDAENLYFREGWPIQMKHPVESRILAEDVVGNTNLEVFVADIGGNVVCLDPKGGTLWHRDLMDNLGLKNSDAQKPMVGSTPMTLGDVNGDGGLDLVIVICAGEPSKESFYVFAINAATGQNVENFPIAIEAKSLEREPGHRRVPQPLLVDLHADQSHWKSYLYRNGTKNFNRDNTGGKKTRRLPPQGGSTPGLHIVQPMGSSLYIIEAGSGCVQTVDIGDEVTAMVEVDDVHGTNSLDLVVSTASGNIVTLESPAVPFHPLNVWNNGGGGGRSHFGNAAVAHGLSASQGIFIRDVSRQYRDVFGVYVPITFEIFDNRPNMRNEAEKRTYQVQMRDGTSVKRLVMRKVYNEPGVYTERVYIPYGPGYYTFTVLLKTSHGLVYEDRFHVGYNVDFMQGFGIMLWLPLVIAAIPIFLCGRKKLNWDDDDFDQDERAGGRGLGILGRGLPTLS